MGWRRSSRPRSSRPVPWPSCPSSPSTRGDWRKRRGTRPAGARARGRRRPERGPTSPTRQLLERLATRLPRATCAWFDTVGHRAPVMQLDRVAMQLPTWPPAEDGRASEVGFLVRAWIRSPGQFLPLATDRFTASCMAWLERSVGASPLPGAGTGAASSSPSSRWRVNATLAGDSPSCR